jgi:hypothetical protein
MKKSLVFLAFVVLPVFYMVTGLNFHRTWFSGDPEYAYLLNGINIANLKAVGHIDNPGTTVQMYSAVVLRVAHFLDFSEKADLQTAVLSNPDYYVEMERKISVIFNALMMLLLGIVSFLFLKNIWFGLILQVTPFLSSNLLEHAWTKVSPEPVLIFTVMVFILLLVTYYCSKKRHNRWYPWIFAAVAGFGLATKATFLPLVVIPFILLEGWRRKWIYLAAIIPAFIIFTAPAITQYPHMAKWFLGLSTHTGTYGEGATGIIDPLQYFTALGAIVENNLALIFAVLAAGIFLFFIFLKGDFRSQIKQNIEIRIILALLAAQILGILMVAKHYHANHYLIPDNSLTGAVFVFSLLFIRKDVSALKSEVANKLPLIVFVGFALGSMLNIPYLQEADHGYIITNEEYTKVMTQIEKDYPGYVKAYYYPTSINPYSALRWGSVYSRQYNLPVLQKLYPEGIFYDSRINAFQLWEAVIPPDEMLKEYGGKILLVGGPLTPEEKQKVVNGGLSLKNVYSGRTQVVYEVDTSNSMLFAGVTSSELLWTYECNADTLSPDKQFFIQNGKKWRNSWNESNDVSRSGKQSVKLSGENIYAMEHYVDSVFPGQQYRITAWRKGGGAKSFIVACSPEKGGFYQQSGNYLKIDNNGWEQVMLNVTVPPDYKGNTLKIYLWNDSGKTVYFDDFSIAGKR